MSRRDPDDGEPFLCYGCDEVIDPSDWEGIETGLCPRCFDEQEYAEEIREGYPEEYEDVCAD